VQKGVSSVTLDGVVLNGPVQLTSESGRHELIVTMGPPNQPPREA